MVQHAELQPRDSALAAQIMADFYGCKSNYLDDLEWIENVSIEAANCAGATILEVVFHRLKPQGIAGVILIPEYHLTVRTWPGYRYAAMDIFARSGSLDSEAAIAQLSVRLGCAERSVAVIKRGMLSELAGYFSDAQRKSSEPNHAADKPYNKYPFQF